MNREEQIAESKGRIDALALAYQHLFGSGNGIKVLCDLREACGFERNSVDDKYDANKTMFREGQRSIFVHINDLLKREVKKDD